VPQSFKPQKVNKNLSSFVLSNALFFDFFLFFRSSLEQVQNIQLKKWVAILSKCWRLFSKDFFTKSVTGLLFEEKATKSSFFFFKTSEAALKTFWRRNHLSYSWKRILSGLGKEKYLPLVLSNFSISLRSLPPERKLFFKDLNNSFS
jgi:hypothetical protein